MKKPGRVLLLLAGLAMAFFLFGLVGHESQSRRALREYQAQLRAKGEKLTYAELTRFRSTNANSSLDALTNAVGRLRSGLFYPGSLELRHNVRPGYARVLWLESSPGPAANSNHPRSTVSWEYFAAELETNKVALEEIRQALKAPAHDSGPHAGALDFPPSSIFIASRSAAQWLSGSVLHELHEGSRQGALQNLLAVASLARVNRDEYTLVSQMIRVAITRLGLATTWEALQASDWTETELGQLQSSWEAVDLPEALEKGFLGERAIGIELWSMVRKSKNAQARSARSAMISHSSRSVTLTFEDLMNDCILVPAYRITSINDDELFHLRAMQQCLDSSRLLKAHRTWGETKRGLDKIVTDIDKIANSPARFRYWFSLMAIPNFQKAANTGVRAETERQLTIAAIAIKRYQLRYGKAPPELAALVPEFVTSAPYDCMSGKTLGYRLKDDGTFVLYSVGEDGHDNGGDPKSESVGKFDLWEGQDAVWPMAAGRESDGALERGN